MSTHSIAATTRGTRPVTARALLRRLVTLLTLILVSTLGSALFASSASAYVNYYYGTQPGAVSVPIMTANSNNNTITFHPRTVYESRAYGNSAQYVCVQLELYRISGSRWVMDNGIKRCYWIQAGSTSVSVPGYTFYLNPSWGYQAAVRTTWQLANGALLGTTVTGYEQASDYRCDTTNCGVGITNWDRTAFLMVT